jgi:hypothetical protein
VSEVGSASHAVGPRFAAAAVLVGPANAEIVLGVPWRRAREAAARAGLRPVRVGVAGCFRVAELLAALECEPAPLRSAEPEPADPAEQVRRALGKKRRSPVGQAAPAEGDPRE